MFGRLHTLKRVVFVVGALSAVGTAVATRGLTAAGPPKAYVGLFKNDAVAVIGTVQNKVLTRVRAASVSVIDTASDHVVGSIDVGANPHDLAISGDGSRVLVSRWGSNEAEGTDATTETTVRTNTARAETGKSLVIDGVSYANHGTKDVRNLSKLALEADDYYFSPTFLRGKPGQKLTLLVESEARTLHNLSISSLGIDQDIPPKGKVRLEVTFPASGVLAFTCKFHGGLGMNGQLLTGDGRPLGAH